MSAVRLEDVEVSYGEGSPALQVPRLTIEPGEQVIVIGPSGAGKTTLLRLLKGFLTPTRGTVEVLGAHLPLLKGSELRRFHGRAGFVHQQFDLVSRSTLLTNVLCGRLGKIGGWRTYLGWFSRKDLEAALGTLEEVRMAHKLSQRASTLSGGEQQRVAIARALAQEPEILLADEPVSNLDPRLSREILELLAGAASRRNLTLVINLHQPRLAREFGSRIVGLRGGQIAWQGRANELSAEALSAIYGESPQEEVELADG